MESILLYKEKTRIIVLVSYSVAFLFGWVGLHKLWVYTPVEEDIYGDITGGVNAVVGGDAFNYIINGTHAISYILLALIFVIIRSTIMVVSTLKK